MQEWGAGSVRAPSDAYLEKLAIGSDGVQRKKSRWSIRDEHFRLFYRFRCMLDNYFRDNEGKPYEVGGVGVEYGFREAFKAAAKELKNENNNEERFKIVARLIRSLTTSRNIDVYKYILFHETVVSGLNTLSAIYTLLARFRNFVLATDLERFTELGVFKNDAPATAGDVRNTIRKENFRMDNPDFDNEFTKYRLVPAEYNDIINIIVAVAAAINPDNLVTPAAAARTAADNAVATNANVTKAIAADATVKDIARAAVNAAVAAADAACNPANSANPLKAATDAANRDIRAAGTAVAIAKDIVAIAAAAANAAASAAAANRSNAAANAAKGVTAAAADPAQINVITPIVVDAVVAAAGARDTINTRLHAIDTTATNAATAAAAAGFANANAVSNIASRVAAAVVNPANAADRANAARNAANAAIANLAGNAPANANDIATIAVDAAVAAASAAANRNTAATNAARDAAITVHIKYQLKNQIDYDKLLMAFIENLFAVTNDLGGLVQFQFVDRIMINWGGLRSACESLFAQVRYFMDLLRPHIDRKVFDMFVNKTIAGSYYWLQEQLMDKIFIGREKGYARLEPQEDDIDPRYEERVQYVNLDQITQKLNTTFKHLCEKTKDRASNSASGQVLARIIFYDARLENSGLLGNLIAYDNEPSRVIDFTQSINQLLLKPQGDKYMFYPNQSNRYHQLYSWTDEPEWNHPNSILFAFNQLIAKLILQAYDKAVGKVYLGLFNPLISGVLNAQIMNPDECYPDTIKVSGDSPALAANRPGGNAGVPNNRPAGSVGRLPGKTEVLRIPTLVDSNVISVHDVTSVWELPDGKAEFNPNAAPANGNQINAESGLYSFGRRSDPKENAVLYSSLALCLKNIASGRNKQGQNVYAAENLADVSPYMKEKFKSQLPVFRNLFRVLANKCEFIKAIIAKHNENAYTIKLYRGDLTTGATRVDTTSDTHGMYGIEPAGVKNPKSDDTRNKFNRLLDVIAKACQNAISGCEYVLRELADSPKYLELHGNFINDYRAMYKKEPLMPLSSALRVILPNEDGKPAFSMPLHHPGTPEYKLAYGCRQLLGMPEQNAGLEQVYGMKLLIDMYNMHAGRDQVDKAAADRFVTSLVKLLRYINEYQHYKGSLTPFTGLTEANARLYDSKHYGNGALSRIAIIYNGDFTTKRTNTNVTILSTANSSADKNKHTIAVFSISQGINATVDLTENAYRDQKMDMLANYVFRRRDIKEPNAGVRCILDLNIVPINVHAMMRDIPLVNLYNYSYNFDRLIIELLYGINSDIANDLLKHLCEHIDPDSSTFRHSLPRDVDFQFGNRAKPPHTMRSSKDLFLALLINPYRELLTTNEYTYLSRIFTGDHNMDLGRPKFLSDQVYNKSLFMELYPDGGRSFERGPRSGKSSTPVPVGTLMGQHTLTWIDNMRKNNANADVNSGEGDHMDNEYDYTDDNADKRGIRRADLGTNGKFKEVLQIIGKLRSQTIFVRNLIFLVNVYRLLRLKLRKDLVYDRGLIVRGHALVRESNTEFDRNQDYDPPRYSRLPY
jgi:hypothetical protein